ncbi:hypothetical protein [Paenibacillus sp. N3.4]|nr:hypothetical protein [Paenibacillus sp. N3.4]
MLESFGLKILLLPSRSVKNDEYRVFIFGDSYVVAKEFIAVQLA